MRWMVVVAALLAGCGGRSQRATRADDPGAGGGSSGAGGSAGSTSVWTEAPTRGDSPACTAYLGTKDLLDACGLIASCPPDLALFLADLEASGEFVHYFAESGCGLNAIQSAELEGGRYIDYFFDRSGELVGYSLEWGMPFGPCDTERYRRGVALRSDCPDYRQCGLTWDGEMEDDDPSALCR